MARHMQEKERRLDKVALERLSWVLILGGGVVIVGSIIVALANFNTFPRLTQPGALIYYLPAILAGLVVYTGIGVNYYAQTGNLRQAIVQTLVGVGIVLAVILGRQLLAR